MTRWTYRYRTASIVAVECERRGYPNRTADGETQFDNTFFDSEVEAWKALLRETEAGMSLDTSARARARSEFERLTTELADDAERLVRVKEGLEAAVQTLKESE